MAGSTWNLLMERLLDERLTVAEHRLALALGRAICGWNRRSNRVGETYLRELAQLDGRSFVRARRRLIERGVLSYEAGNGGRGNRSLYTLHLDRETPAVAREIMTTETPAVERVKEPKRNSRSGAHKPPLYSGDEGVTEGVSTPKTSALRAQTTDTNEIRQRAFDAYLSAGGSLSLERERGALARAVTSEAKAGTETAAIVAACRSLGRERAFPGLLKQRVAELAASGGPCAWEGLDRMALSVAQLSTCECVKCGEWRDYRAAKGES